MRAARIAARMRKLADWVEAEMPGARKAAVW